MRCLGCGKAIEAPLWDPQRGWNWLGDLRRAEQSPSLEEDTSSVF